MTGHNPLSRLCNSEFRSLNGLREWLAMQCGKEQPTTPPKGSRTKKTGCLQTQVGDKDDYVYSDEIPVQISTCCLC